MKCINGTNVRGTLIYIFKVWVYYCKVQQQVLYNITERRYGDKVDQFLSLQQCNEVEAYEKQEKSVYTTTVPSSPLKGGLSVFSP